MKAQERKCACIIQIAKPSLEDPEIWDLFRWQQDCAHKYGLPVTALVTYQALLNPARVEDLKKWTADYGDEIGLHMWQLPDIVPGLKCPDDVFHNLPVPEKRKVIDISFDKFYSVFGKYPATIISLQFDAPTLNYIKRKYPDVKAAVHCPFEEGRNEYLGHKFRDTRLEFLDNTEGSPWWPWIPCRANSLCPAGKNDDKIDIVCLPWLVRDMILSFDSRNDFYSSELGDLLRKKTVNEGDMSYVDRFFNEYMNQAQYNGGYTFYLMLQEADWFTDKPHCYDESPEEFKRLYDKYLCYLADKMNEETARFVHAGEFADWFKASFGASTPETICLWNDIRFHSGKQYLWYLDNNFRILFDLNQGGSIVDFRPYVAKVKKSVGIDSPDLWDHTYPYLIQGHHRHCSIFKCLISYKDEAVDLSEKRVEVNNITRSGKEMKIELAPVRIDFPNLSFVLQTTYIIREEATIQVERRIVDSSQPKAEIKLEEVFVGCFGTGNFPTDLKGIKLRLDAEDCIEVSYEHRGRKIVKEDVKSAGLYISEIDLSLALVSEGKAKEGFIWEGNLMNLYYTLGIKNLVKGNRKSAAKLVLKKGNISKENRKNER